MDIASKEKLDIVIAGNLLDWLETFLTDRRSAGLSKRTIEFYLTGLKDFLYFCATFKIADMDGITANMIRKYLLQLENTGHTGGGIHAKWRAVRAFLNWYELEIDDPNYRNPVRKLKVRPPKLEPLDPANMEAIKSILADCENHRREVDNQALGVRDRAIILTMLDTGLRAMELASLTVDQVNPITGVVSNVLGKGDKYRTVYIGRKTRQALRKYLNLFAPTDYLWVNRYGDQLTRSGLRQMIESRCDSAGVPMQPLHSFRRLCALTMYRATGDIYAVQNYLGHKSTKTTERYLQLQADDAKRAHIKGSPVDHLL